MAGVLLAIVSLAAGLYWNAQRLNETERKLVGVWGNSEGNAVFMLPDRRVGVAYRVQGKWAYDGLYEKRARWRSSFDVLEFRYMPIRPQSVAIRDWIEYILLSATGGSRAPHQINLLWNDQLVFCSADEVNVLFRSHDPVLLQILRQLSRGESIEGINADRP